MDLLNHDLAHEFPQYLDTMRRLKASDALFASLFSRYDADNRAIATYEQGVGHITDEALEVLKKNRLKETLHNSRVCVKGVSPSCENTEHETSCPGPQSEPEEDPQA